MNDRLTPEEVADNEKAAKEINELYSCMYSESERRKFKHIGLAQRKNRLGELLTKMLERFLKAPPEHRPLMIQKYGQFYEFMKWLGPQLEEHDRQRQAYWKGEAAHPGGVGMEHWSKKYENENPR
jgi:hypothetical protein